MGDLLILIQKCPRSHSHPGCIADAAFFFGFQIWLFGNENFQSLKTPTFWDNLCSHSKFFVQWILRKWGLPFLFWIYRHLYLKTCVFIYLSVVSFFVITLVIFMLWGIQIFKKASRWFFYLRRSHHEFHRSEWIDGGREMERCGAKHRPAKSDRQHSGRLTYREAVEGEEAAFVLVL